MISEAIAEVAKLLSKVFGFAVEPDGFAQLTRERQLKFLMRGINDATEQGDWAAVDRLLAEYRGLRGEAGP